MASSIALTGCAKKYPHTCPVMMSTDLLTNIKEVRKAGDYMASVDVYVGTTDFFLANWAWSEEENGWLYKDAKEDEHFPSSELKLERIIVDSDDNLISRILINVNGYHDSGKYKAAKKMNDTCMTGYQLSEDSYVTDLIDFNQVNITKGKVSYYFDVFDNSTQELVNPVNCSTSQKIGNEGTNDFVICGRFRRGSMMTFEISNGNITFEKDGMNSDIYPLVKDMSWTI